MGEPIDPLIKAFLIGAGAARITHYAVVESDSLEELTDEVCKSIAEGWQPWGGLAVYHLSAPHYVQALVKVGVPQ